MAFFHTKPHMHTLEQQLLIMFISCSISAETISQVTENLQFGNKFDQLIICYLLSKNSSSLNVMISNLFSSFASFQILCFLGVLLEE